MTLRTVTPVVLAANTRTNDLVAGADLSATIADLDTFTITPVLRTEDLIIVVSFAATTTITFNAGDEPPSMRAGLGTTTITGANTEVRLFLLEGGRFIKVSAGVLSIQGSNAGGNCKMAAYRVARTG